MANVDSDLHDRADALLDRALQGEIGQADKAELERHFASCPACAAEREGIRIFKVAAAAGKCDEALNRAAVEVVLRRLAEPEPLGERLRRRLKRLLRPASAVLGPAAAVAVGLLVFQARQPPESRPMPDEVVRPIVLKDGSVVTPMDGSTLFQIMEQTPLRTTVRLSSGSAQFRVRHDSRRLFRVDTGPFAIEDLGTVFRVTHEAGERIRVAVSEGRVAVLSSGGGMRIEVGAGEDRVFSAAPPANVTAEPTQQTAKPPATASVPLVARPSRPRPADSAAELLQAADTARRSGHPQAALAPLRSLVERYPRDPRAPSAAFTLGWVLLTDLGRAREAAAAFSESERLAPRGALAEDAAARVSEAWQKAGDQDRAAQAARHYQQMYPNGRYISLMRGLIKEK